LTPVFEKCTKVVDMVAPWLGPIGIGLKLATAFVSIFVKKEKPAEEQLKEIGLKNYEINGTILKGVTEVLK